MIKAIIFIAFIRVGGFEELVSSYSYAVSDTTIFSNSSCGLPPSDYFNLIRDTDSDFPWTGMSFGLAISSIWYFCSELVSLNFMKKALSSFKKLKNFFLVK